MEPLETLVRRLRLTTQLDAEDVQAIEKLPIHIKTLPSQSAIVIEGDRPAQCVLIVKGFACRCKTTDTGKRQILSIHIAGDIPDLQSLHLHVMDHDLKTLSPCTIAVIPHDALRALTRSRPLVAEALWRETLIDAAVFREWIVNVGRRPAAARLAHLISELRKRLEAIGIDTGEHFDLPMTQLDLADALGLTPVHVNRVMKVLRNDGLMEFRRNVVRLKDAEKLARVGGFDDLYLHQSPQL
jgi:CRP-like cAMP-binding protein